MFNKLLALVGTTSLSCSLAVPIVENLTKSNQVLNEQEQLQFLKKDVLQNSVKLGQDVIYEYNGSEYRTKENIIKDELSKNPITVQTTMSNPNKIIKNYATNELDSSKVYDLKSNNLVKVYKNALGKAVLPDCNEINSEGCLATNLSAQDRALNSYVNKGLIREKYSYDQINWFNSIYEADEDYKKNNFTVKSSLFYYYNGQYFNAFNQTDNERLKAQLTKGYRYEFKKDFDWGNDQSLGQFKNQFSYDEYYFMEYFKNELKTYFMEPLNQENIIEYKNTYQIELNANQNNEGLRQWFTGIESTLPNVSVESHSNEAESITLNVDIDINNGFDLKSFIDNIEYYDNWKSEIEHGTCLGKSDKRRHHTYKYVPNKANEEQYLIFRLDTFDDAESGCPRGYNDTAPGKISINPVYNKNNFSFIWNQNAHFFNELVNVFDLNNIDTNEILQYMLGQEKLARDETYNMENLLSDLNSKSNIRNWTQFQKNNLFNYIWSILLPKLRDTSIKDSPIQDDWMYGKRTGSDKKGYQYSYQKINGEVNKRINEDFKNLEDEEQVSFNFQNLWFETSVKNWKENFYAFQYEKQSGGIPLRRMYYVDQNRENDISQFSDPFGNNIASSESEALNIANNNALKILKKGYIVYDINGSGSIEDIIIADNEDIAADIYKQKISLDYKLINKNELKILKDQQTDITDLISDGEYYVYTFLAKNGNQMYFKDYKSARMIYENQISLIGGIREYNVSYYSYSLKIDKEIKTYKYSSKDDIDSLVQNIYKEITRR